MRMPAARACSDQMPVLPQTPPGMNNASKAIDISPEHPKAFFRRGQAQRQLGEFAAARDWSMRAVRSNQAHFYVVATAAALCHLAGDKAQAAHWVQLLRARRPDASVLTYLRGLPFASAEIRATLRGALNALGIPD